MTGTHPTTGAIDVGRVDGNAAAGPLSELFAFDITTAIGVCGRCGARASLAEAEAELDDEGVIVLCRSCGHTLFTYVKRAGRGDLMFSGLTELSVGVPAP